MNLPAYAPEELLGIQTPRVFNLPDWGPNTHHGGKADAPPPELGALGREVVDLADLAGLHLDPWQAWVMEQAHVPNRERQYWNPYTERYEYQWSAFEVGLVVSRQNGKGSCLEARELAGLFIFGERLIIHTAHKFDTAMEHMNRILELIESTPELDREVMRVARGNGKEGVELKNGQRLRFRARMGGGGRGFTADCVVLDEAMDLDSIQVGAMLPTVSARPNPQIWVTGSAGTKSSTHFGRMRNRAMSGRDANRLFWAEWSIDPCTDFCDNTCEAHDAPDTIESYAKANPGLGIRITVERIESERSAMDPDEFLRERLGVGDWPVDGEEWRVISEKSWGRCLDAESEPSTPLVLAVATSPDRKYSCIAAAGANQDGRTHVEITSGFDPVEDCVRYDHRPGVQWVVPVIERMWQLLKPACVIIDKRGPEMTFIDDLEAAGVKVICPTGMDYAQACGDFYSAVVPRNGEQVSLAHLGQQPLNAALAGADKRDLADTWAWSRKSSVVDISPLVATTLAAWGLKKHGHKKTATPWIAIGGKVIS